MKSVLFSVLALCMAFGVAAKERKAVYIVTDGIPADYIERVHPRTIFDIASRGGYCRAYTGGEIGAYSQTPTISAVGYTNILTGTWVNKHNVPGNDNLKPRYQYRSLFRTAKEQRRPVTTALASSWVDNRTVLIGEGKPETGNLKIDYVFDGYENDKTRFPDREDQTHIFAIGSLVALNAAECIRDKAPDLTWVYLWFTDSGFHPHGDGAYMDRYVHKTDSLVAMVWDAVKYREKNFDEEWMIVVTTDHGRDERGFGHGGQSARERSTWIAVNRPEVNSQFSEPALSLVDINPTICRFLGFEDPQEVEFEKDGVPFIGRADISGLKSGKYDDNIVLTWDTYGNPDCDAEVFVAFSNKYLEGGHDEWVKAGSVPAKAGKFVFDKKRYPASKFYKFVVRTPANHLNRWYAE